MTPTIGCRDNRAEGKALLLRSLQAFPWNWSAWLALGTLQGSADLDADSALPRHWMRNFFLTHVCVEGQENEEALGRLSVRPSFACLHVRYIRVGRLPLCCMFPAGYSHIGLILITDGTTMVLYLHGHQKIRSCV